jgi:hypothetical protein
MASPRYFFFISDMITSNLMRGRRFMRACVSFVSYLALLEDVMRADLLTRRRIGTCSCPAVAIRTFEAVPLSQY